MEEIWRDIPEYEGIYEVSNHGRVRTKAGKKTWSSRFNCDRVWKQRVLKQKLCKNQRGRYDARVELYKDGGHRTWLVSRLVGLAWCQGYAEGLTINHRDGNPLNNRADNLEWIPLKANIQHGFNTGLYGYLIPTVLISVSDKAEYAFASEAEAARFLGRNHSYIHNCLRNGRNARSASGTVYLISKDSDRRHHEEL